MKKATLGDLQESLADKSGFKQLDDYPHSGGSRICQDNQQRPKDKVFLDKFLLTKLLGRDIPVIAIFLHDVQRAKRGESIFGINSTFKTNHFLGYTVALTKLDGVYYVDPRPDMLTNERLREQIRDFQSFLVLDLWTLAPE
jgi:hypothetical protein